MSNLRLVLNDLGILNVEVIYHDSDEDPEGMCTNTVISFKVGERLYQFHQISLEDAINKFKSQMLAYIRFNVGFVPDVIFCVVTKFNKEYFIDWQEITNQRRIQSKKFTGN